jgi:hypothetical protein
MRDDFIHSKGRPQAMVFPENHLDHSSREQSKGAEQILLCERGLWSENVFHKHFVRHQNSK